MLLLTGFVALSACRADRPPEKIAAASDALPNVPLPPGATFVSRAGSADALQLVYHTDVPLGVIADYYRSVLSRGQWRLVSDTKDAAGVVSLYAEQNGPPLWIRVVPDHGANGSTVEIAGAVVAPDRLRQKQTPPRSKPAT